MILRIAVPSPLYTLLDYLAPPHCDSNALQIGVRVRVPLKGQQRIGILVELNASSTLSPNKLRPALAILDSTPVLAPDVLAIAQWAAGYYYQPIGEVLLSTLPLLLRDGTALSTSTPPPRWHLTEAGSAALPTIKRAPQQLRLLEYLAQCREGAEATLLRSVVRSNAAMLHQLHKKGWIELKTAPSSERTTPASPTTPPAVTLNTAQAQAVTSICAALAKFQVFLLAGVTGSGKTEVYLRVIAALLERGQQALILTPEIGLTPQLAARCRERLGTSLAVSHSGLGHQQRLDAWSQAAAGTASVIIGTRSAVFMPLPRLGIIIVDEEHDPSFKQQEGFRYHARDLAIMRAQRLGIPIVLGSATPALESYNNAQCGRYQMLELAQRVGVAQPPSIEVLDIRKQILREGLSSYLLAEIAKHLHRDQQVLLFLNRRGFSPVLMCHACAWVSHCQHCDARMTVHLRQQRLICHHCGSQRAIERTCPACGSSELRGIGHGTERIESALQHAFPDVALTRMDRDSTSRRGSLEALLANIHSGGRHLLVGTQMLAKGHHFPDVTLVGIVDADQGFYGVDFRASERIAQLILQVAGRAGRADKPGKVIIQTRHPQHPLLHILVHHGYNAFANAALAERQAAVLPPFAHQALLQAEATDAALATNFLRNARTLAGDFAQDVEVLGPAPAPMERRAGRYRAHLLVQAQRRQDLHQFLKQWLPLLRAEYSGRQLRWSLDVDPQEPC